jgi:hypothetical protein
MVEVEHHLMAAVVAALCRHTVEVVAARADSEVVVAVTCPPVAEVTRRRVGVDTAVAVEATTAVDVTKIKNKPTSKAVPAGRLFYLFYFPQKAS